MKLVFLFNRQKMGVFYSPFINHLQEIIIVVILVTSTFAIGSYFREIPLDVIWEPDDAIHISVASSFRESKSFDLDFPRHFSFQVRLLDEFIDKNPTITYPQIPKGPMYYVFLGSFYDFLNTNPEDQYLHASLFNNILISIFHVLFFFWLKKKFNLTIAIFSSLIVLLIPYVAYNTARIYLHPLEYIFFISALFFLDKKTKHYIIFGIFAALAHLTHPYGIFLGASYVIFLLISKEFKGSLITMISWHVVLVPWFLRNYYLFNDIGRGLYLPFSEKLSGLLSFLPQKENLISTVPRVSSTLIPEGGIFLNPMDIFIERFFYNLGPPHMDYHVIFLIAFSGFAFFTLIKFKDNTKLIIITVLLIVGVYFFVSSIPNPNLGIVFVFFIPLALIYTLRKLKPYFFEKPLPRIYKFSILYAFIVLIGSYFWTLIFQSYVHSLVPMFQLATILLTPLAIIGLIKIINRIIVPSRIKHHKLISILIMVLVLSPIMIHQVEGFEFFNRVPPNLLIETDEVKNLNEIIRKNIPSDSNVGTNQPSVIAIKTNLKSVLLPLDITDTYKMQRFIEHYDISYLIFYDVKNYGSKKLYNSVSESVFFSHRFPEIYSIGNSHILKVEKQTEEHLKEKISEYLTLRKHSQALEGYNAIVVFYDREIDQLKKSGQLDKANTVQLSLESFTKERDDFVFTVADLNKEIIQKLVESNQYFEVMEVFDETIDFFEIYVTKPEIIDQEKKAKIQQLIEEFKIGQHISLMAWDELLRKEVPILLDLKDDEEAIEFYKSLRDYYQKHYKTFEKSGNFNDAKKIKNSLVEYVGYNARLFMDHEMLHDAERAYLFLINIDKYDRKVWAEFGELYERMGKLLEALSAYNKANFLPDKDYTDKIEELRNKLES